MSGLVNPSPTQAPFVSHQTGLSAAIATANTPVNIGAAITSPRNGILRILIFGHVSADLGGIDFTLTRGTTTYYFLNGKSSLLSINYGLFGDTISAGLPITSTVPNGLFSSSQITSGDPGPVNLNNIPILNGDVLQFRCTNNTASTTVYIDDLTVMVE